MSKVANLPVTVTPQNELLVPGRIAGQPVQFRVDTGSQFTIMDFPVRKRFGVSVVDKDLTEQSVGGRIHYSQGTVPGFSLGDFPAAGGGCIGRQITARPCGVAGKPQISRRMGV